MSCVKHGQQHNPRWIPTSSSTLAQLVSTRWVAPTWASPANMVRNRRVSSNQHPPTSRHLHWRPGMRRTITVQQRNQRGVDCQLNSPEEGQSVRQDLHAPLIRKSCPHICHRKTPSSSDPRRGGNPTQEIALSPEVHLRTQHCCCGRRSTRGA